jgi:OOP family OmpA-OmpF porin
MKGVIVHKAFLGLISAAVLSMGAIGCQNKLYDENAALRSQNLELQQQLDESHRQSAVAQAPVVNAGPAIPASNVQPKYVEPAPAPIPADPPVSAKPDLGGLETRQDAAAGTTTVNLPSDVFFASGQAVLLPEAKKSLVKLVIALKKEYANKPITIQGYTDSDPIRKSHWKSNEELSQKRAEAVRDYLASKGVDATRITTEGLGDAKPRSKTDKAKNRRVELVVFTR